MSRIVYQHFSIKQLCRITVKQVAITADSRTIESKTKIAGLFQTCFCSISKKSYVKIFTQKRIAKSKVMVFYVAFLQDMLSR